MLEVNGKEYPLWSQFVEREDEWIGGTLIEDGYGETKIEGIELTPNGKDSASFRVKGKDFSCSFDVRYGGISCEPVTVPGEIPFYTAWGDPWRIRKPDKQH